MTHSLSIAQAMPLTVPGQDLNAYIRSVSSIAILSAEEEQALAVRFYQDNDLDALLAQFVGQRSAACTGTNDDDHTVVVVVIRRHDVSLLLDFCAL